MLLLTRNKKKLKILDIYIDKWLSSTFTVATIFHMRSHVSNFQYYFIGKNSINGTPKYDLKNKRSINVQLTYRENSTKAIFNKNKREKERERERKKKKDLNSSD